MTYRFTFLLFLFLMSCLAFGQKSKTLTFGDELIDGAIIKDYTNKWKVTFINAEGVETPNRVWTDYGQVIELDGKKYFHRVQDLYDPNMNLQETWINMVELQTLTPVSFSRTTPKGKFTFMEFEGNTIINTSNFLSEDLSSTENSIELEKPVYDWNLYGMLLVGLPFEKGVSVKIPIYSAPTNQLDWLVTTVDGQEKITLSDGEKLTTWKLTTDKNLTFWLTKKAPYVHQLELELQNNSKLIWKTF